MVRILTPSTPSKKQLTFSLNLLIKNIKVYNKTNFVYYNKKKSIFNKESKFVFGYEEREIVGFLMFRIVKCGDGKKTSKRKENRVINTNTDRDNMINDKDNRESNTINDRDNKEIDAINKEINVINEERRSRQAKELSISQENISPPATLPTPLAPKMYIYELHVSPTHRSKGTGSLLLKKAFELKGKWNCQSVTVFVDGRNLRAIGFYKRNGMRRDLGEGWDGSGYEAFSYFG